MSVLELSDVRQAYQHGVDVLAGVDLSIGAGEVVGLLGRNGAGKTTLLQVAMGMIDPQRGTVRIFGLDPRKEPVAVRQRIGYVSENQILPDHLRVADVIAVHRELIPGWDESQATELLRRFDLPLRRRISGLSKGQARQVALLCAVSHKPELLLLDEPAGGLDPVARREFLETSIHLLNETGSAILFSSHHMTDVERVAGRVLLLHDGRIQVDSELDELREAFSLALVPRSPRADQRRLRHLPGCLSVRERTDALHAVFRLAPRESCALIERELGVPDSLCRSVNLEEMFVELVGGLA